jgi:hypothetical protein
MRMRFLHPLGFQDDPLIFNLEYDNLKTLKLIIE